MGWYKVGNRILSDADMYAESGTFLDVLVPSLITWIGVWMLSHVLSAVPFFVVHTTTTKLTYVVFGISVFLLSYAYRKLIVALGVIAFFGFVLFCIGMAFLGWVLK